MLLLDNIQLTPLLSYQHLVRTLVRANIILDHERSLLKVQISYSTYGHGGACKAGLGSLISHQAQPCTFSAFKTDADVIPIWICKVQ